MAADALLEVVLECLPCGVLVLDLDGRALLWNRSAELMLDFEPAAPGRPLLANEPVRAALAEVTQQGFALPRRIEVDVGEGHTVPTGLSGSLLRDAAGEPKAVVLISQDMTAAEEVATLSRREARRTDIVSQASHEIRNPLTAVLGHLELLLALQLAPHERKFADLAHKAGKRVLALIRDMLDSSRIEAKTIDVERAPVDLARLLAEVADEVRTVATDASIRLEVAPDLPLVPGDAPRLTRVFVNLIENAVKYSPGRPEVSLQARRVEQAVDVLVSDHGVGIDPSDLSRIFEKFFRTSSTKIRRIPGTGLGLSMVKTIVEAHGGTITVESEPGKGSTFRVRLPLT